MWLLAQLAPPMAEPPVHVANPLTIAIFEIVGSITSLIYFPFFIWMMIHCIRNEPDRSTWIWIMIFLPGIGPVIYFMVRYLPAREFPAPAFLRRWTRGRELARLEVAAHQIGNPHQFVQWGDALREVGLLDRANSAYERALSKEPDNLEALWGSALIATKQKRFNDVLPFTRRVLDKNPQYKFGDVSLAHGRALMEIGDKESARPHLEAHVRRWRHPEAVYLLAVLCSEQGDTQSARKHLVDAIQDIDGSPTAIARKFGRWKSLARKLLRKLPS